MDHQDDLKVRIDAVVTELLGILRVFEKDIGDNQKAVSFGQVKEIETSILRLKKQNLPVPTELKELKIKLFSKHEFQQERLSLFKDFLKRIGDISNQAKSVIPKPDHPASPTKVGSTNQRLPNYNRPLGSKGYRNLEDYLIPVIKLMWDGLGHRVAFRKIAEKLGVRYNTVSSQCTRALGLTTETFIEKVTSKTIVEHIEKKYPESFQLIESHLRREL